MKLTPALFTRTSRVGCCRSNAAANARTLALEARSSGAGPTRTRGESGSRASSARISRATVSPRRVSRTPRTTSAPRAASADAAARPSPDVAPVTSATLPRRTSGSSASTRRRPRARASGAADAPSRAWRRGGGVIDVRRARRAPTGICISLNDASLTSHGGGAGGAGGSGRSARPAAPARAPTSRARGARSARASVSRRASRIVGAAASDDATRSLAAELATLVRSDSPSDARVLELIAALEDARAPADLRAFDGAFEVAWSEGTMAWRALVAEAVQAIAGRCRAGQRFALASSSSDAAASSSEPNANAALNFAELFGGAVTITASGVFRPDPSIADAADPNAVASGARCPLPFDVRIAKMARAPLRRRACGFAHPRPGRVRGALRRRARARVPLERGDRRAGPERLGPAERRGRSGAQREERGDLLNSRRS